MHAQPHQRAGAVRPAHSDHLQNQQSDRLAAGPGRFARDVYHLYGLSESSSRDHLPESDVTSAPSLPDLDQSGHGYRHDGDDQETDSAHARRGCRALACDMASVSGLICAD